MKMDRKLTLLFSILVVIVTTCNSIYAFNYNISLLHENTYNVLRAIGTKMLSQAESFLQLMDYTIEELTSNIVFMNAMRSASTEGDNWDEIDQLEMQNLMFQTLFEEPLTENFYRVSVYAPNGFYLSNHFEKNGGVVSMSEEARDIIASLPYLERVNTSPSTIHIIEPHMDPWNTSNSNIVVFSAVRAVTWHGQGIGYIEVSASVEELMRIFSAEEMDGLTAHAVFDDGLQFFRFYGDDAHYPNAADSAAKIFTLEDGSQRFAIRLRSKALGLNVYVAQKVEAYDARARHLLIEHLTFGGIVLLAGIAITIAISKGLTRSIHLLTDKLQHLSSRKVVDTSAELPLEFVTSPRDREIHTLEQVFNDLMLRLRKSSQREVSLQNTTIQAQLNALQTQINPHFVYNTLNVISAKGMESGNEEILDICDQFAQMLRYSSDLRSRTATLAEEVANARRYLLLAKARYEDQLEFCIHMPEDADALLLPKLTLQPLVENAITHGFKGQPGKKTVTLLGEHAGDQFRIVIRDSGNGFSLEVLQRLNAAFAEIDEKPTPYADPSDGHIGLINTYLRLYYYSRGKIRMRLYNNDGAVVEITLPCERSEK